MTVDQTPLNVVGPGSYFLGRGGGGAGLDPEGGGETLSFPFSHPNAALGGGSRAAEACPEARPHLLAVPVLDAQRHVQRLPVDQVLHGAGEGLPRAPGERGEPVVQVAVHRGPVRAPHLEPPGGRAQPPGVPDEPARHAVVRPVRRQGGAGEELGDGEAPWREHRDVEVDAGHQLRGARDGARRGPVGQAAVLGEAPELLADLTGEGNKVA